MAIAADHAPTPGLAERFRLRLAFAAAIDIGRLATGGRRVYRAASGGSFAGDGIDGDVIGGGETMLERPDGVGVIEANYLVRTADGALLRLIGTGYRTSAGDFIGTRMSLVFEVDEDGPHARLSTRAYVAEAAGDGDLVIAEVL